MGPLSKKAKISKQTLSYTLKKGRLVPWVQPATRKPEIVMVVRISEMAKPFFESKRRSFRVSGVST